MKAYDTLKEPGKRHIYDLGLENINFRERKTDSGEVERNYNAVRGSSPSYYQNKWYGFKPLQYFSLHDEYWTFYDQEKALKNFTLLRFGILIALYIFFDLSDFMKRRNHEKFVQTQNEVLSPEENLSKVHSYIEEREKLYVRKDN